MTSRGSEGLKAAIRRSLGLIVGLVIVGIVAVNLFEQLKGPSYEAISKVQVPATPLAQVVTGTQPAYVDPQRSQDTAAALAASPQVYSTAFSLTGGRLGSADSLRAATSVSEVTDTDILAFTSTDSSAANASAIANAVANAYVTFSAQNAASSIQATITKLKATLAQLPRGTQRSQVQTQLNRLQLLLGATSGNAKVVQQAVSAAKTSPRPTKDTVLGLVIGLVVALIIVAVREAVDTRVRSESDVEELLLAPVLARVRPLPKQVKLVSFGRHQAMFSDTYSLLAAQLAASEQAQSPMVVAVTSAVAQEGKTSTAANLAVALARRGARVILADFDFRKPDIARLFNIPSTAPGALQMAAGEISLRDALWTVSLDGDRAEATRNGSEPRPPARSGNGSAAASRDRPSQGTLRLLPAGGTVLPDDEQAEPLPLGRLLALLRAHAGVVVVDTAPALLTADMTDFAEHVDMTLIVVRQGYASKRNLRLLTRYSESWPTTVAGAVLTDVPQPTELATYYGAS